MDFITDEMIVDFDVFGSFVKNGLDMKSSLIITVYWSRIGL